MGKCVQEQIDAYEQKLFKFFSDSLMEEAKRGNMPFADCKKMIIAACINGVRFAQNIPNNDKSNFVYFDNKDKISKIMNKFQKSFYEKLLIDHTIFKVMDNFNENDISMIIMNACIYNADLINRLDIIDEELEHYYNEK